MNSQNYEKRNTITQKIPNFQVVTYIESLR